MDTRLKRLIADSSATEIAEFLEEIIDDVWDHSAWAKLGYESEDASSNRYEFEARISTIIQEKLEPQ